MNIFIDDGAGGGGGGPTWVSSTSDGIGTVSDGDLVLVFLLNTGGAVVSAPTGWTRHLNTTEENGYGIGVYSSLYDAGDADVNSTNFPYGLGYLACLVYSGATSVLQIGAMAQVAATVATVVAPALTNPTGSSSALISWSSTRDPAGVQTSSEGMTSRFDGAYTYFRTKVWEQLGAQSGTRSFVRSSTSFNATAVSLEIG